MSKTADWIIALTWLPIFAGIGGGIVAVTTESIGLGPGLAAPAIITGLIMLSIGYIAKAVVSNRIGYVPTARDLSSVRTRIPGTVRVRAG